MADQPDSDAASRAPEIADPEWFRAPTSREHALAAWLFVGCGVSFGLLFIVLEGWWFRWAILAMGVISVVRGVRHAIAWWRQAT